MPKGVDRRPDRRAAAGVPQQVTSATKPQLARRMLQRALATGVPAAWVTAGQHLPGRPGAGGWASLKDREAFQSAKPPCSHEGHDLRLEN
jgi:DDE superfamily endonuclease